jgi:kynureninase
VAVGDGVTTPDRALAIALDRADPLAGFRDRFHHEPGDAIYLDGNSLGRLPLRTREALQARIDEWGSRLVGGWERWLDLPRIAGDALAPLIGARPGEVVACDSVTVNLFKLATAVLRAEHRPGAILVPAGEFPTDRYVLEGVAAAAGVPLRLLEHDRLEGLVPQTVAAACAAEPVSLLVLSAVDYRSGALADVAGVTAAAHAGGARILWDLSHAIGAVPVDLTAAGADLAVGCTYKYLNAGPGALAWLYVREELLGDLRNPVQGWFGQRDQFLMERAYDPQPDIRRFLTGTPGILELTSVIAGAELIAEAGPERLRAKSISLTSLLVALHDAWLAPLGFRLASPREAARRGSHVALAHEHAWPICRALIERADVIPDFRPPDVLRLGIAPVYTSHVEVWDALDRLRRIVERGTHLEVDAAARDVT